MRFHRKKAQTARVLSTLLLTALALTGCRKQQEETSPAESPFGLEATVSTNRVRVGDRVTVDLRVRHPAGTRVQWPAPPHGEDWALVASDETRSRAGTNSQLSRLSWDLAPFATGRLQAATGTVRCLDNGNEAYRADLPPLAVTVGAPEVDAETALRPIKGLLDWPSAAAWWPWMAAAIILAAAAAVTAWFVARRRAYASPAPAEPPEPAHIVALRRLQALRNKAYIQAHAYAPFYVELSDIVRRYIEDRFGLRAPEQTTEEFIEAAADSAVLPGRHRVRTRDFLTQCDLVKFARHEPSAGDMEAAYDAAERLVRETLPTDGEDEP